jgi:hypothetical protein
LSAISDSLLPTLKKKTSEKTSWRIIKDNAMIPRSCNIFFILLKITMFD